MQTILVVEDDLNLQRVLKIFFEKQGYQVLIANHGLEALDILKETKVSLILTDIEMPYMDGITMISKIPFLPVVVYSGNSYPELIDEFSNVKRVFSKPTNFHDISNHVSSIIFGESGIIPEQ
ncbi:MAG: response regulator [Candidatus Heimdallarchaeota archaeon]|nr:response regulator [Candidatus Heimdallarchaeota archaeon]